ncbi:hypothetical protein GQ457_17G011410 [Hibiscus cannabinus]
MKDMYSNFKEQAIDKNFEYFKTPLKYEKNLKIREAITQKFTKYLCRVEKICVVRDEGGHGPASNGDTVVATGPKSKPKNGSGGG